MPENELSAVDVTVRMDGQVYQRMSVIPNELTTIRLDIPHSGENIIEIETAELEDELTARNNQMVFSIEGVRDAMRVLLAVGEPTRGRFRGGWR